MPAVYFAFGPGQTFFLFVGGNYRTLGVPDQFNKYVLQSENCDGKQLSRPSCIALGPAEGEYYAMYTTAENTDRFTYDFKHSHEDLMEWLNGRIKVVGTHIAVGPRRTFYACVPGGATGGIYYDKNIPASLKEVLKREESLKGGRRFTSQVSLGYGESWFILWPNGDISWDFNGHFDELDQILRNLPEKAISYLTLNPWAPGQYFLLLEEGSVHLSLPAEWALPVQEEIANWQNRFKSLTSGIVRNGKPNTSTRAVGGSGLFVHLQKRGTREGAGGSPGSDSSPEHEHDLPPPYDRKGE